MLRRDLRSFGPLGTAPDVEAVQAAFGLLEQQLRWSVHHFLPGSGDTRFVLDRAGRHDALQAAITGLPADAVVLVRGEPDVGKSALTLSVADAIRTAGGAALAMSLRDLPDNALTLYTQLGGPRTRS